jgi:hypothetical protein
MPKTDDLEEITAEVINIKNTEKNNKSIFFLGYIIISRKKK